MSVAGSRQRRGDCGRGWWVVEAGRSAVPVLRAKGLDCKALRRGSKVRPASSGGD